MFTLNAIAIDCHGNTIRCTLMELDSITQMSQVMRHMLQYPNTVRNGVARVIFEIGMPSAVMVN